MVNNLIHRSFFKEATTPAKYNDNSFHYSKVRAATDTQIAATGAERGSKMYTEGTELGPTTSYKIFSAKRFIIGMGAYFEAVSHFTAAWENANPGLPHPCQNYYKVLHQ
jgi:hypothetical protein